MAKQLAAVQLFARDASRMLENEHRARWDIQDHANAAWASELALMQFKSSAKLDLCNMSATSLEVVV